ncbi:hypothetical protein BS78_04G233400 [Paspalum vaginatum]|nr:hypothetical protein BS78_04G233400 [Paspalum vaginatum]
MVADVLGRLPPSSLAAARCVCKHWCSIIDGRRLLRDLLPLRLDGIFCSSSLREPWIPCTYFFARPPTARRIAGDLDFVDTDYRLILDHCNGLLLLTWEMTVVNPATRQWATLPDCKSKFDPRSEWRPSPYTTHVFSSTTCKWEERFFVRQGQPVGTIADIIGSPVDSDHHGVYFQGALYVHCQNNSVMRIACFTNDDNKYQMIKLPSAGSKLGKYLESYLGKTDKKVYYALLHLGNASWPHFQVWLLNDNTMEWVLRSDISLQAVVENFATKDFDNRCNKPWILADYRGRSATPPAQEADITELGNNEWDFDNGGVIIETKYDEVERYRPHLFYFLGFHPYKEIALFRLSSRVLCYQLSTSKVQELGLFNVPFDMEEIPFFYTPCWMRITGDLFSRHN